MLVALFAALTLVQAEDMPPKRCATEMRPKQPDTSVNNTGRTNDTGTIGTNDTGTIGTSITSTISGSSTKYPGTGPTNLVVSGPFTSTDRCGAGDSARLALSTRSGPS